jgi:NTE family protein
LTPEESTSTHQPAQQILRPTLDLGRIQSDFFEGLPKEALTGLLNQQERRSFPAGEQVLVQGERSQAMYLIVSGTAEVFLSDTQGQEHHLTLVGPGQTLGEMSLLTGDPISATVRVTNAGDLEALVLRQEEVHRLASVHPAIYRNLATILSDRLARTNQRILKQKDQLIALPDEDAPPQLGYALACSLAWHTRSPILLLVLAEPSTAPEPLRLLAAEPGPGALSAFLPPWFSPTLAQPDLPPRAHLLLSAPQGAFAPLALEGTLEALSNHYEYVLVQGAEQDMPATLFQRSMRLSGMQAPRARAGADLSPGHSLRAWATPQRGNRPDDDGSLAIPALSAQDEQALQQGLLPASTPAGRALGWAARHLARLKVGLALGAGASKGYAHLGVLHVLKRVGLTVDYLAGTSIGAVVASLLALGYSLDEMAALLDRVGAVAFRLRLPTKALLSSAGLRAGIQQIVGERRIEDLDVPLALVAADLTTWQEVVFRRGLLWSAVLASVSLPGIYPPQRIGPYTLVDGGVLNPVPSDVVAELGADRVLAVRLSNRPPGQRNWAEAQPSANGGPSVLQTMLHSIELLQSRISTHTAAAATMVIEPILDEVGGKGLRHFSQGRRFVAEGAATAEAALPLLAQAFPWLRP